MRPSKNKAILLEPGCQLTYAVEVLYKRFPLPDIRSSCRPMDQAVIAQLTISVNCAITELTGLVNCKGRGEDEK